jgi:formylglycine-generating enzyme required for sulfatase activity
VSPSGRFMMGSPESEAGRYKDEGPQHLVSMRSFALGKYEVTFSQWDACLAGGGCNGYRPKDESWGRGTQPVINVNWDDGQAYVGWLSKKTSKRYRLASESEWEYAARAGTKTARYWGEAIGSGNANCRRCGSQCDGASPPATCVGEYKAPMTLSPTSLFKEQINIGYAHSPRRPDCT